jgi:hypothetical protein
MAFRARAGNRNIFKLIAFKIARQPPLHTTDKWSDPRQSRLQETFEILFIAKDTSILPNLDVVGAPFPKKCCTLSV